MQFFAYIMIMGIFLLAVAATAGGAAYSFYYALHELDSSSQEYTQTLVLGAVLSFLGVIALIYMILMCKRMELTSHILSAVSGVLAGLPGAVGLAYATAAASIGWLLVWLMGAVEMNNYIDTSSTGVKVLLNFWMVIAYFWGAAVLDGILQVTVSTIIATWYFDEKYLEKGVPCCKPAVCGALGRAATRQLGPIAFGALVLSILRAIITAVQALQRSLGESNLIAKVVLCCVNCILKCLESCLAWVTAYAYVYVAIYGVSFIKAGSEVMELLGQRGLDMVAASSFVEPVLWAGALLGGAVGILWGEVARTVVDSAIPRWVPYAGGFLGGFVSVAVALSLVTAGTKALLVAYAEEPGVLKSKKPELAEKWGEGKSLKDDAKRGGFFGGSSNA